MKFTLSFKTPDVMGELDYQGIEVTPEMDELMERFIEYGENITVEFDTEKGTATAVPR